MGTDLEKEIRKTVVSCLEELSKDGGENVKIHNSGCEGILSQITDSTVQRLVSFGVRDCRRKGRVLTFSFLRVIELSV